MDSTGVVAIFGIFALTVVVIVAIVYGYRRIKGSYKDGEFDLEK